MSQCMRFPTMWYVWPAKPQISLRIRAVWSERLLVAWVFYDCKATVWTSFGVSKLNRRLRRLVWACTCQNVKLLEISCCSSFNTCTLVHLSTRPNSQHLLYVSDTLSGLSTKPGAQGFLCLVKNSSYRKPVLKFDIYQFRLCNGTNKKLSE